MKKIYIIAAVAAIISGALLYFYLNKKEEASIPEGPSIVKVLTVSEEVPAFTELTPDNLMYVEFPEDYVPKDAVLKASDAVGSVSDGTLYPGEIILSSMIGTEKEKARSMSYAIPEGMRAMTVEVDNVGGVAGYIAAGDFIDLLLYVSPQPAEEEGKEDIPAYTYICGDNIEVLAVGDVTFEGGAVYTSLTLSLTPEQCREVYAAQSMCNYDGSGCGLNALLRRHGDKEGLEHTTVKTAIEYKGGK